MSKEIKIFGERNSCNNYLVKLLDLNLEVNSVWRNHTSARFGNTHGFPIYTNGVNHIVLVKNPYAWLLSLHKKPHGTKKFRNKYINLTFDEFLCAEWRGYDNAVKRYNDMLTRYISFLTKHPNTLLVHSEKLQENPEEVIRLISDKFNIRFKKNKFIPVIKEVDSGGNLNHVFNKVDYYVKELWRERLTENHINTINKDLYKEVVEYFNYKLL